MKIAVIGGGISGLGAGVILGKHHEVHLFEAAARLGGHAHTVEIAEKENAVVPMDIGFLVFNELTYPHLTSFFKFLGVRTVDSDMSLSVRSVLGNFEWGGTSLNTIFGQRRNFLRPSFYRMLWDILRFHREAAENLALARRHAWTLQDLLTNGKYSSNFAAQYLIPIGSAIWSTPEDQMLAYPADTFLQFFINHKLLQIRNRPIWKTVAGGSNQYVQKARNLIPHVHLGAEVLSVNRSSTRVGVVTRTGEEYFDRVVFATHAPTTLRLLKGASQAEQQVLSAIGVVSNRASLHQDQSQMPVNRRCWSAWNVVSGEQNEVALTYYLNRLQPLNTTQKYFLSLNLKQEATSNLGTYQYDHPRFTREAVRAQRDLQAIQGNGGVYFAGAWTRYGFHEDGLLSAVNVAALIGCTPPWEVN